MKWMTDFNERLKLRYQKLYGPKGCESRIRRDKKGLAMKAGAALGLLLIVLCAQLLDSIGSGPELRVNRQGEIIEITRPSKEQGAVSFSAEVRADTKEGTVRREYYITIEPSGTAKEQQEGQDPGSASEERPEEQAEAELRSIISKLNADTASHKVRLPGKLKDGGKLVWTKTDDFGLALYIAAFAAVLLMLYKTRFHEVEKEERKARESIARELPGFINKILLRLNAGSVLTTAFMSTVEDSGRSRNNAYFYQQMEQIARSVKEANGMLHEELRDFAKRSGVNELIRMTNIINDNISKGADLSDKLKKENELLWFSRKQQAEEQGRLAETKLTMPLVILLMVLIMITIAPALMGI